MNAPPLLQTTCVTTRLHCSPLLCTPLHRLLSFILGKTRVYIDSSTMVCYNDNMACGVWVLRWCVGAVGLSCSDGSKLLHPVKANPARPVAHQPRYYFAQHRLRTIISGRPILQSPLQFKLNDCNGVLHGQGLKGACHRTHKGRHGVTTTHAHAHQRESALLRATAGRGNNRQR